MLALRERQAKNMIATLLLSQGVPMLMAGDEFLRTQGNSIIAVCRSDAGAGAGGEWDRGMVRADGPVRMFGLVLDPERAASGARSRSSSITTTVVDLTGASV